MWLESKIEMKHEHIFGTDGYLLIYILRFIWNEL